PDRPRPPPDAWREEIPARSVQPTPAPRARQAPTARAPAPWEVTSRPRPRHAHRHRRDAPVSRPPSTAATFPPQRADPACRATPNRPTATPRRTPPEPLVRHPGYTPRRTSRELLPAEFPARPKYARRRPRTPSPTPPPYDASPRRPRATCGYHSSRSETLLRENHTIGRRAGRRPGSPRPPRGPRSADTGPGCGTRHRQGRAGSRGVAPVRAPDARSPALYGPLRTRQREVAPPEPRGPGRHRSPHRRASPGGRVGALVRVRPRAGAPSRIPPVV